MQRPGAAVREVAELLKHRVVSPTHVHSVGVPLKPCILDRRAKKDPK